MNRQPKKLLDQVRSAIRLKHDSIRTEEAYVNWIRRYILFHNKRHPREIGHCEIEAFLITFHVSRIVSFKTTDGVGLHAKQPFCLSAIAFALSRCLEAR